VPVAYSADLRHRVIDAWEAKEGSQRQLAQRFKVSLTFVRNLLRHYRQTRKVEAKQRGGYTQPKISAEHLAVVQALIEEQNDILLKELCERFAESTGIFVSIPTMHRAVQRLQMRHKKNDVCQ
jgi:transposase